MMWKYFAFEGWTHICCRWWLV